jgi:uncharacterized protein involved in exopolysaccharide biosynthesis
MSVLEFVQLILRNKKWVIYFPIVVGIGVFLLSRNIPKEFTSETIIYTGIASGFNPDNDFDNKIDFHAVNSRFDNLINIIGSRETRKDVAVDLLAFMIHHPQQLSDLLDACKKARLAEILDTAFVRKYRKADETLTAEYLQAELTKSPDSAVYQLIFGEMKNPFNVEVLEDIKAERFGFSDMLKIEYSCADPFTCKKTLDITTDIFLSKYKSMRIGEANQAVKYFREQTAISKGKLQVAETSLKAFRAANGVINYYEQTKYIADQKEDIDKNKAALQMELSGLKTALEKVESRMNTRYVIQLQSEKVVQIRDDLSNQLNKNGISAIVNNTPSESTPGMETLKKTLKEGVDKLYALNTTVEGVPSKSLLEEWLSLTISKQECESKLNVLVGNQAEFEKVFDRYAPMGSELSKLEREVETAEKEYLNLLHNLNQAILRENNLEVSENVSVIDEADMPLVPNPSKRLLLVIASVLSCIILVIVSLIISQYLDNSIASPIGLEKITGFKPATAFMSKNIYPEASNAMDNRSFERWQIALGKMPVAGEIKQTILVIPFDTPFDETKDYLQRFQAWLKERQQNIELLEDKDFDNNFNEPHFVLSNKLFAEQQPDSLKEHTALVLFFFDATDKLDEYAIATIEAWKQTKLPIKGVLVNTAEQHISKYLGEIPRKRSKFRTFMKQQFKRYAS